MLWDVNMYVVGRKYVCKNVFKYTYVRNTYEGWNFNSGNYLFTTDTK